MAGRTGLQEILGKAVKDLSDADKAGYLEKKLKKKVLLSMPGRSYQKYYCVIHHGLFYYYEKSKEEKPSGIFYLKGYEFRESPHLAKDSKKNFIFELVAKDRECHQFLADNELDLQMWGEAVNKAVNSAAQYDDEYGDDVYDYIDEMYSLKKKMSLSSPKEDYQSLYTDAESTNYYLEPVPHTPPNYQNLSPTEEVYDDIDNLDPSKLPAVQQVGKLGKVWPPPASDTNAYNNAPPKVPQSNRPRLSLTNSQGVYENDRRKSSLTLPSQTPPTIPPQRSPNGTTGTNTNKSSPLKNVKIVERVPNTPAVPNTPRPNQIQKAAPNVNIVMRPKIIIPPDEDYENMYYGKWDCKNDTDDELPFKRGDIIHVVNRSFEKKGWWVGRLNDQYGLVPYNYLIPAYKIAQFKK